MTEVSSPLIISTGSSLHAVGVPIYQPSPVLLAVLDSSGDFGTRVSDYEICPDYLKPGSTVSRPCPKHCNNNGSCMNSPPLDYTHCTKGTQSYTIPDNLELIKWADYSASIIDTEDRRHALMPVWKMLRGNEQFGNFAEDRYILVSRDLKAAAS